VGKTGGRGAGGGAGGEAGPAVQAARHRVAIAGVPRHRRRRVAKQGQCMSGIVAAGGGGAASKT
jgi:hypothetical protein